MADSKLQHFHQQLRACRLCADAGHAIALGPVFSGVPSAQVMTIGQAPGPTEAVTKRPFNAGSGKRLFQWLTEAGFDEAKFRATQYMTSVTKCYPGKSAGGHGDRVPSKAEQALCRPWLEQEIEFINPALIIPIGRLAIELFFDKKLPLEHVIGTELKTDSRVIIPLPHPSGASTWTNKAENQVLLQKAIRLIAKQRVVLKL